MARNKYGIVDFGLLEINPSSHNFGDFAPEDIGSILSEKQKRIIDEVSKGNFSKLIYIELDIIDDGGEELIYRGLASIKDLFRIQIIGVNDSDVPCYIQIFQYEGDYTVII